MKQLRNKLEQEKGKKASILDSLKSKKEQLKDSKRDSRYIEEAILIAQEVAKETQEELKYHISELVSLALSSIFDDPYTFEVLFETKRNKTEARIVFYKDGEEMDPKNESGGGPIDVAAFALRVALMSMQKDIANTIILDEPLRFLSVDLQPRAGAFIKEIAEKLGIQFIIVTHNEALIDFADKVFSVTNKGGISYVKD